MLSAWNELLALGGEAYADFSVNCPSSRTFSHPEVAVILLAAALVRHSCPIRQNGAVVATEV